MDKIPKQIKKENIKVKVNTTFQSAIISALSTPIKETKPKPAKKPR